MTVATFTERRGTMNTKAGSTPMVNDTAAEALAWLKGPGSSRRSSDGGAT